MIEHGGVRILRGLLWLASVGLLLAFLFVAAGASTVAGPAMVDRPAPPLTLTPFTGRRITLEDLRGQIVVVNFWASWCEACRQEAPLLERTSQEYRGRGVRFIGVAVHDTEHNTRTFARRQNLTYPNGLDQADMIARAFGLFDVPETYFIDRHGRIVRRHVGPLTEAQLRTHLDALLDR